MTTGIDLTVITGRETPLFISSLEGDLFGVLTKPSTVVSGGVVALSLWGSGPVPSFGPGRVRREMARRLAEQGLYSLRLDYLGCGAGHPRRHHRFDSPCIAEACAAIRWLEEQGLERVILVGSCYGARVALAAAGEVRELAGVALLSPPVWDDDRQLASAFRPELGAGGSDEAAGPLFLGQLQRLVERGVPVLVVLGRDDQAFKVFSRALNGQMGSLVRKAGEDVSVEILDGRIHGYSTVAVQQAVIAHVAAWASRLRLREAPRAER